jgi:NAD+-dependent farnesol dehydrogenase
MKFAVTGANGLVGQALVLDLARSGHEVVAIYRSSLPTEFMDFPNIKLATGDIRDKEFLIRAVEGVQGVFHVAAFAKPWNKDKKLYYDINEQGTKNVGEACVLLGIRRLVYTASAGIHGCQQNGRLIDEQTWPSSYLTDYEQSKCNGMIAALSFEKKGLEVNIVSPARVYAPGEVTESNVPARMIDIYLSKGFGIAPTDGKGIGSYVFIDDVVKGHRIAMECDAHGEEFLLGGENVDYIDFFKLLARLSGKKKPLIKVPYSLSLFIGKANLFLAENFGIKPTITTPWVRRYLQHWGVSSNKIRKLGYHPISLENGMKRVLAERKN